MMLRGDEKQMAILGTFERARMCRCADGMALKNDRPGTINV